MENRVGQQLGNYRLMRLLGAGGFAEVYLGEHLHLQTQSAIKLLHTQLANEDIEHFRNEARTLARLVHPNIVRVFDFGVENRIPYLVMDYAPNGTLRQRHPRGTILPLPTIVTYVKQIADALQYAHDEKFIHRDIKPENMLIGRRNEILLSDFGIAIVAQSSRLQSTQEVIGTVSYMAPEQIQAHPRPASDQYSLGIIVYEWLCGSVPFTGSFTEVAVKHTVAPVPPLRERVPTISPDIEAVVMTALQKDPHDRFGTVGAFANALEQTTQSKPRLVVAPVGISTVDSTVYAKPNPISTPPTILQSVAHAVNNTPAMTPPVAETVFQPPLSSILPDNSTPVTIASASLNTPDVKIKQRSRLLIDYLLPAKKQTREEVLWHNARVLFTFVLLFIVCNNVLFFLKRNFIFDFFEVLLVSAVLGKWRGLLVIAICLLPALSPVAVIYFIPAFIMGSLCELGIGRQILSTFIASLTISIVTGIVTLFLLSYVSIQTNIVFILFFCLSALLFSIILPLLWQLPRVKRNLAKE